MNNSGAQDHAKDARSSNGPKGSDGSENGKKGGGTRRRGGRKYAREASRTVAVTVVRGKEKIRNTAVGRITREKKK